MCHLYLLCALEGEMPPVTLRTDWCQAWCLAVCTLGPSSSHRNSLGCEKDCVCVFVCVRATVSVADSHSSPFSLSCSHGRRGNLARHTEPPVPVILCNGAWPLTCALLSAIKIWMVDDYTFFRKIQKLHYSKNYISLEPASPSLHRFLEDEAFIFSILT